MSKKGKFALWLFIGSFLLAVVVGMATLLIVNSVNLKNSLQIIGFFFYVFLNLGVIIFAHKIFQGKTYDIIFSLCCAVMISFFLAIILFGLVVNNGKLTNFDIHGVFHKIMRWDWRFYGIQFVVFFL